MIFELWESRFILVLLVLLVARVRELSRRKFWSAAIVNIFGTLLHEICHYLMATVLLAAPARFSIWPQNQGNNWVLGSVTFRNPNWFNLVPISFAPLLLQPLAWWIDLHWMSAMGKFWWNLPLYAVIMVLLVGNSIPSTTDIRCAFSNVFGVAFWFFLIGGSLGWFLGVRL